MGELARELYWFQNKEGMWIIHAELPPEQGQLVIKTLQAVARPLEEERKAAWQAKKKARMQEVARGILRRKGTKTDTSPKVGGGQNSENSAGENVPDHLDYAQAAAMPDHPDDAQAEPVPDHVAYARAEEKISAETFSQHMNQIRADALVAVVEHFLASRPDYKGLQGLNGAERCQIVMHVDAHHIRHWAEGGEIKLENLVTLCRFHHRQLHRGCFDVRLNGVSAEILAPDES